MPTNAQLKALTQSQLVDPTAPNSVPKTDFKGRIDAGYDYTDQEIAALGPPGISTVSHNDQLKGNGTVGDPLRLYYKGRANQLGCTGTAAPSRVKNYFQGMELPAGITESFARTGTGTYTITYSGVDTIPDLNIISGEGLFLINFGNNPNIAISAISNPASGGNRSIIVEFTNKPNGTLTDAFNYLFYEVRFYPNPAA